MHDARVAENSTSLIYVTAFRHIAAREQIEGQGLLMIGVQEH